MKQILKALACTMACATLLTSCELSNKSMSVTIAGVDKINIEGAKALASLRDVSGTRAGGGETLLYAIDEENNIKLPEISCNFVFDEEMTEEERQEVIKSMNATIQTQGIYDFGPYILVRYTLSYTSSYDVINGLGHIEVSLGFLHSAIRKSDGKNFMVSDANYGVLHNIIERLNYWVLRKSVAVSESETCLLYSEGMWSCNLIKVSEQEDKVYISTESDNVPDWDVLKDQHGNVYLFKYNQILTYEGERPLEGTYNTAAQLGNQVYAFAWEDGRVKVYKILDGERQLDADIEVHSEFTFGQHIGTANGEILWRDGEVVSYNPATKTLKSKGLAIELHEIMWQNPSLFLNEHMFYARSNGNGVEVVKINLLDDSQEIIPVEIPSDRVVEAYHFIGSAASDYVQLYLSCQAGKDFVYDVYGNSSLPNFADYEVNKVIPLK